MELYPFHKAAMPKHGLLPQLLRVMRITAILLLVGLMQVSAASFAQRLMLVKKNVSLKEVFTAIKTQTGYNVVCDSELLKDSKNVSTKFKEAELPEVLDAVLKNQNLDYTITDKTVVIKEKEPSFIDNIIARFQAIDVSGRVVDENGFALVGATVSLKGGGKSTTTNANGEFSLSKINNDAMLQISFIGYVTKEIKATSDLSSIKLELGNSKLDEVQIIAYGQVERKYSTSNIGSIKADAIAKQPVNNPLLALAGRVPGLFIAESTGVPGGNVDVTVQGLNSLRPEGQAPFYVIDGVPYAPQFTNFSLADGRRGIGGSTFNFINPADIESISILKDADATAIYGSRGANGAILITTKKGKAGKTEVDLNVQQGWGKITRAVDLLKTPEYLQMRKEAFKNAGQAIPDASTPPASSNYDLTVWDQNRYTDWQKVLVGGTAHFTDVQASVSGGSVNTQFLAGYGYNKQTSVYPNSLADVKGNLHLTLSHSSKDNRFKYLLSGTYLLDKNELNGTDLMAAALKLAPNAPSLYKADGSLNFEVFPNNPLKFSFDNPLAVASRPFTGNTSNLTGNNNISYEILTGLQLKATAGYNRLESDETALTPISSIKPDAFSRVRAARFLNKSIKSWIVEPQLTYTKSALWGTIDALVGGTLQQTKTNVFRQAGSGYTNDKQLKDILSAPNVVRDLSILTLYKYNAIFGRLNYRLFDKYILNLTARRDGSSRFGDENKLHTFYAVAGAWLFGDEDVIKRKLPWLSLGKFRVSYGTTGNDQIEDYLYESLLSTYAADQAYQGIVALAPTRISNPYLQWEETRKLNLGADFGFLKNAIELSVNYYRNISSNQLVVNSLPIITGFSGLTENFDATIQNTGIEILLSVKPIQSKNFSWLSAINFTSAKNKLVSYPGLATSTNSRTYFIGEPVNVIQAYKFAGVNPTTGIYEFFNSKGEKTSSPGFLDDRTELIDPNPKWFGGFSTMLEVSAIVDK
ncbi:MAG: SusC/RagA family TonB-linked outer membrane protein [Bacteroidota bacterium]